MANVIKKSKDAIIEKLDYNNDGQVDIQDIITLAFRSPGVHVDRAAFLKKELFKNHTEEEVEDAIARTPALAGIPSEEVNRIADDVIKFERRCVSGISAALGAPGGFAMAATIPADIIQYYGYMLRATQKLLYLYGFPEIKVDDAGLEIDTETINEIILCLGIMNGVAGANNAIKAMAKALGTGVEKQLLNKALTKGTFYPFVKNVMKWFGIRLTKNMFTGFIKDVIPVVGGVVGGGITFATFKPCCYRLKNVLKDTKLSNPNHNESEEEKKIYEDIIEGEVIDVEVEDYVPEDKKEENE